MIMRRFLVVVVLAACGSKKSPVGDAGHAPVAVAGSAGTSMATVAIGSASSTATAPTHPDPKHPVAAAQSAAGSAAVAIGTPASEAASSEASPTGTKTPIHDGASVSEYRAGDFSLKDLDGHDVRLSSLRGKLVIVDFWASYCPPCQAELPALDRLAASSGATVVGVNVDKTRDKALGMLKTMHLSNVRVVLDPSQTVPGQYDVKTMPSSFVVDRKGLVRYVHPGYEPGDEKQVAAEIGSLP
jgi:thiol-disulfide isomerase/thioredoxin